MMKKNDCLLIFFVVFISIVLYLIISLFSKSGDTAIITVNGEIYCEKKLSENSKIDINGTNAAVIENGEIYMTSATCPDKLCIRHGKISDSSEKIICLPNKIVIEVTKKSEIDAVVK